MHKVNTFFTRLTFVFLLLMTYARVGWGQGVPIPPSPNASALLEYANVPVNYYNGLPSINVPLYDLPGRQLSVPVSLSYHASGIKVQDVASSYGLGWNLNAGGAITRVVRGLPDHWINRFGSNVTADPALVGADDIFQAHWRMTIDLLDGQPDVFYFNFMGRTGSFVLDYNGDPVLIPYQNLEIKPAIGPKGIGRWEIIDENGTKFTFGDTPASVEKTSKNTMDEFEHYNEFNNVEFESTWYLSKARSAFNDEVAFTYSAGSNLEYQYYSEIIETTDVNVNQCYVPEKRNTRVRILSPKYLNQITTSQGKVQFTFIGTGTQRQDLTNGKFLDKIEIKNLSNQVVKAYFFEYNYFNANLSVPNTFLNCNDKECRRLKLVRIRENQRTNSIHYRHFKYNNNTHLPPRYATHLDHWGYFNGIEGSNGSNVFCQNTQFYKIPAIDDGNIDILGQRKLPSAASAQANMLTEIVLPTGGSTKFQYEGNVIGGRAYGGVRIRRITAHDGVDTNKDIIRTFNYLEGNGLNRPRYYISTKTGQTGPNYFFFFGLLQLNGYNIKTNTVIYSESFVPLFDLNGHSVGYTKVSEHFSNGSRVEYQYTGFKTDSNGLDHSDEEPERAYFTKIPGGSYSKLASGSFVQDEPYTFTPNTSRAFERGLLEKQTVYNSNDQIVSRVTNEYDFGRPGKKEVRAYTSRFYPGFLSQGGNVDLYATGIYKYISRPVTLKKTTTETYDQDFPGNDSKKTVWVNEYFFSSKYLHLRQVKSYNPEETEEYLSLYYYVTDFDLEHHCFVQYLICNVGGGCANCTCEQDQDDCNNQANLDANLRALQSMIDRHMTNQIVETQEWITDDNGKQLINATYTKFKKEGSGSTAMYLPSTVWTLNDMRLRSNYQGGGFSEQGELVNDTDMRLIHTYLDYDNTYGNLLKEKGRDEVVTRYNWDATRSRLTSVVYDEGTGGKNFTTSYTYKNLVGVETITDPNGLETNFEYDSYNRLKLVRDHENKIVASYEYNYTGENGSNYNYVKSENMLVGATSLGSISSSDKNVTINYFDGLGRPVQQAYLRASPPGYNNRNIIRFFEYDNQGLQKRNYLPYMANSSATAVNSVFRPNAATEQANFYNSAQNSVVRDLRPFVENEFENTPLNRVLNSFGPGKLWKDNNRKMAARLKVAAGNTVRKWGVVNDIPVSISRYPANTLTFVENTDEENRKVREYSDVRGLMVLREVQESATNWQKTYYVYDGYGNLRFIIPPEASASLSTTNQNGQDPIAYVDSPVTLPPKNFNNYVYNSPGSITLAPGFQHNAATDGNFSIKIGIPAYALENYIYQFRYDEEQRLIRQKDPGADWVFYVYDKWDRLVMSQDGLQRSKPTREWTFVKYDRLNRAVMTGIFKSNASHNAMINNVNASNNRYESTHSNAIGYSLSATYPKAIQVNDLLIVNHFDNYSFKINAAWDDENPETAYNFNNPPGYNNVLQTTVKGLSTGAKVKVLGTSDWLNSVVYYDYDYQAVQVYSKNHKGGIDKITNHFTFSGRMLKSTYRHRTATEDIDLLKEYEYDHVGRVTRSYLTVENNPRVLLASLKYNEIGQLMEKNLHSNNNGASFLQSVDLQYNIRGWLTHINNSALSNDGTDNIAQADLFGMELIYNQASININGTLNQRQFNGNISAVKWQTNNLADDPVEKVYGYTYDYLNQLKTARYATRTGSTWTGNGGHYDVNNLNYDKNGNIRSLNRYAAIGGSRTKIDGLTYAYGKTNQLKSVEDNGRSEGFKNGIAVATEYNYDKNGNMEYDLNKGVVGVMYNYLNLPEEVELDGNKTVQYTYDAAGNKLNKTALEGNTVVSEIDYVGVAQYEDNNLSFLWTDEGRIIKNGSDYEYEYYLTDHQGNTRLTFGYMKEVDVYEATMETENNTRESADFINLATRATDDAYNITPDYEVNGIADEAARLNGSTGSAIGPGKVFTVSAGDKVDLSVFAKYAQATGNSSAVINNLVSAVTSGFGIVNGGETQPLFQAFDANLPMLSSGITGSGPQVPKAYINYLIFDSNNVFQQFGYQQVTTAANNAFEQLALAEINVPVNGAMYVYVANESSENVDVWFDDLTIIHKKNTWGLQVTNSADYYPFGGQIRALSYQKPGGINNAYGYQGLYAELDENTGWHGFELRQYDAFLGRWTSIDPYKQYASPYLGMGNSPVNGVNPDGGLFGLGAVGSTLAGAGIGAALGAGVGLIADEDNWSYYVVSGAVLGANIGYLTSSSGRTLGNKRIRSTKGDNYRRDKYKFTPKPRPKRQRPKEVDKLVSRPANISTLFLDLSRKIVKVILETKIYAEKTEESKRPETRNPEKVKLSKRL